MLALASLYLFLEKSTLRFLTRFQRKVLFCILHQVSKKLLLFGMPSFVQDMGKSQWCGTRGCDGGSWRR
jgi:hypothetical protein